jgi:hypothetical protein
MKVIVAGSRNFYDYDVVEQAIKESGFVITEIVSGRCRGVDSLGEDYANKYDIPVQPFIAKWNTFGLAAGPKRNKEMAEYVGSTGGLVLVWDGTSDGSNNMLFEAKRAGLSIYQKIVNVIHKK